MLIGPLTQRQAAHMRVAEELDAVTERMLAAARLPVRLGLAWSVADCLRAYMSVRLQRADNPMPLTDMERVYVHETKLTLSLELSRLNLDGDGVLAQMAIVALESMSDTGEQQ